MISHEHRCIFVHVPRTGGTSIELAVTGTDWQFSHPREKHLRCSQARDMYGDLWHEYLTFTSYRNDQERLQSGLSKGFNRDGVWCHPCEWWIDLCVDVVLDFRTLWRDWRQLAKRLGVQQEILVPWIR